MCVFEDRFVASRFVSKAFRAVFYPEPRCRAHRNRFGVSKTKDGDVTVWYLQLHGKATQRAFFCRKFVSTRALLVSFWSVFHESKELPWVA